ncbi:protein FAM240C-like [Camelus ferus]|uniref:Protein FAM240C-like n=2 Tax=Camelus TaxID=9836 RepID=A0A8B8T3K7_CAMFR|nr:protein FAM240C-like [Camelus ferus]
MGPLPDRRQLVFQAPEQTPGSASPSLYKRGVDRARTCTRGHRRTSAARSSRTARKDCQKMSKSHTLKNPARVSYDAGMLKTFWEKKIELHTKQLQNEDMRIRRSALDRLRGEWAQRLERRNQMLQSNQEAPTPPGAQAFHTQDPMAA